MTHSTGPVIKNPSWWKRRTQLERGLVVLTMGAIGLAIILGVLLAFSESARISDKSTEADSLNGSSVTVDDICFTKDCVQLASSILENMDTTVNPCDDFYQFACGAFRKKFIPDDRTGLNLFSKIGDNLEIQLRRIIEEKIQPGDIRPLINAKNIYTLCMNESRIEALGDLPLRSILAEMGDWPVLGKKWDEGSFNWKETIYKFRAKGLGNSYLLSFSVGPDALNVTQRVLELDQASLGLSREYLVKGMDNKRVRSYYDYMVDIAVLLGADPTTAKNELKDSLTFEMKLANISLPNEQRRNFTQLYNVFTLSQLQTNFSSIPWAEYFSKILPKHIQLSESEPVVVASPTYIKDLEQLLEQTPKRHIANYLVWRITASMVGYMPEVYKKRQLKYVTATTGRTAQEPRWKECVGQAHSIVPMAVGSSYVRRYFNGSAKQKALSLVNRIREEMYLILENVDWMDDETKKEALDKAKSITTHIGYPDELLDDSKIVEYYGDFEVNDDGQSSLIEAVLNSTRSSMNRSYGRLREPYNKTDWRSHSRPAIVNAFYSSLENSIQFPAGILQDFFFSENHPNYINYGGIGFVIGHEITHGFDDQGRQFDKDGKLRDWWDKGTKAKYVEKVQCIIEQYGNYTDTQVNLKLNGINTQGENVADNGGVKEAYRAYQKHVKEEGVEPRLPGLQQYSPNQMFWLAAANTWCSTYRDESLVNRITLGYHSPGEFRVRGPLSNLKEFSNDFNCPMGSPMNPEKKCIVW